MRTMKYKKFSGIFLIPILISAILSISSCSEKIDESNLYTFTGETIEDFLSDNDDYSSFNYIVNRAGLSDILSSYGTYTCFAPNNAAVKEYIDSLYNDESNNDLPHNGMTGDSLGGLTDSLCKDIARFHLASTEIMGVDMSNGMTITTLLGRDINTAIDSISGSVVINSKSQITSMDNELENGVLHEINHVIKRSNLLVAGEMDKHPELSLFAKALTVTGLADSLTKQKKTELDEVTNNTGKMYVPSECIMGYTVFAETNSVFAAAGIHSLEDLVNYANNLYGHSADAGSGWYDYYRDNDISVSTGTDYKNKNNCLNMFVRYHILKFKASVDKLLYSYNEVSNVTLYDYYETMLPYTLLKVERLNGKRVLNPWYTNNTLTDRVAELGSSSIRIEKNPGIEISSDNIQALNGYILPIKGILYYGEYVPHGVLNERMRFDDSSFLWELMSNNLRCAKDAEIKALNGGVTGSDGNLNGDYVRFPSNFFDNMVIYNGNNTRLYYLPGQSNAWSNFHGDEFNCKGAYDFAFRLPPVPDGTYEVRLGYTANSSRGMVQFYLGTSSDRTTMKALDIPLDMRVVPVNNADGTPDVNTGWCLYTSTDDEGVESDANMRNLGYMRGPLYYTLGAGGSTVARANPQDLRRILVKQQFKQGEYWLRFKTVLPKDESTQFHLDYIEFCPENVYNNTTYAEDMY